MPDIHDFDIRRFAFGDVGNLFHDWWEVRQGA